MSNESIFQHTSFFTLNETQKTRVRDYAQSRKFTLIDTHEVFKLQADLSVSLDFWDTKVNVLNQFTTTSDDFRFMNAELLPMLKDEMLFALYIFCARYQLELAEGRGDILHDHGCQIIKCNRLINDINKALGLVDKTYVTDNLPTVMDDGVNDF